MTHEAAACAAIEPSLALYVGGDLDATALDEVRAHLAVCSACRGQALAARAARRVLRDGLLGNGTLGRGKLGGAQGAESIDLWPAILAALTNQAAPAVRPARRVSFTRTASLAAGLAACLAFAAWSAHELAQDVEPSEVDPGAPGLAELPAPQVPGALVSESSGPLVAEEPPPPIVPASYEGGLHEVGLRRLAPGEGRMREGALPVYYAPEWLNGPPRGVGAPIQPAGLDRAVPGRSGP